MRAWAFPVALLLVAGALAGCVNTPKDTQGGAIDPAATDPEGTGTGTVPGSVFRALPGIPLTLTSTSPKWVEPDTAVAVTAVGSSALTYVWSIGPLPGTVAPKAVKLDTGSAKDASDWIQPGASKSLTFTDSGVFQMHCHPHPYMLSNVTVIEGYAGPKEVTVQIVDGSDLGSYRYVPENFVIGTGTKVVFQNNGTQPHTATLMSAEPALKKLDLTTASGEVTATGDGWQRIRVVATDATGRFGAADLPVYVKPLPTFTMDPIAVSFNAGGLPEQANAPFSKGFTLDYNGTLNLSWSFKDLPAQNGAPVNNAQVDIHVFPQGSEQDVITSELVPEGEAVAKVPAGTYTLLVIAKRGVSLKGEILLSAVYSDVVPPEPTMASAGGGHGDHGGHAGH